MPNLNTQVSGSAIAFIDRQVADYQSLIAGVTSGTEVVVLDENRDAIDQITQILALRSNVNWGLSAGLGRVYLTCLRPKKPVANPPLQLIKNAAISEFQPGDRSDIVS